MSVSARARHVALACLAALPLAGRAQDLGLHGYLDARLVDAPEQTSWTRGGLGKTRYGDGDFAPRFGGAALVGTAQLTPSLFALAGVQFQATDRAGIDVLEAWLRWRPVSTTRWRGSLQIGSFFPPVSLENDAVGWTSPWTLTPSAINSWIGEELRSTGLEARLERRGERGTWELRGALFQRNEPAGNLLAIRGWSLSDLTYGLGSRPREPDAWVVVEEGGEPPRRYDPFRRIGRAWGSYQTLAWRGVDGARIGLMHYDNHADPGAFAPYAGGDRLYAWHTYFWSLAATAQTGPVTWIAQAMDGDTVIEPRPGLTLTTRYRAAFLLAGWSRGVWRPTLRLDHFSTSAPLQIPGAVAGEHGNAVTAALNWRPHDWLRLTLEVLRIDSTRKDNPEYGLPARRDGTQVQLSARLYY
ncbi:hypothetical protein [Fulvimonas yonginensis]|uniref:Porin n=1 Tax=Fulvimonas yonginensis TaxID=1495200 RepID=A0ABU8JFN0_9GAMM